MLNNNLQQQGIAIVENYLATTESKISLGDIMSFDNGFAFQSSSYQQDGIYRVITIKNVQDGYVDSNGASYIACIPSKMKSCCILHEGDTLLSLTGNVGRVGIVYEHNLLLNQRVAKVIPFEKSLQGFIYFLLRNPTMKSRMQTIAKGTAQQNLSPVETLKLPIAFHSDTVSAITLQLNSFYTQLVALFVENKQLATLRDTILPKLMSGEIDVSDVEI